MISQTFELEFDIENESEIDYVELEISFYQFKDQYRNQIRINKVEKCNAYSKFGNLVSVIKNTDDEKLLYDFMIDFFNNKVIDLIDTSKEDLSDYFYDKNR